MELQEIISKIEIWQEWHDSYSYYVPRFIESAKSCENWQDWNQSLFHEFFERGGDQCVSSLKQGYFTKEEQNSIKEDWKELAPMLKEIAESQDKPLWDVYNNIKTFIRQRTNQDRRAATNRLIASLQPNLLCTIIQEDYLNETFNLLRNAGVEDVPEVDFNSWIKSSHLLLSYFKDKLKNKSVYDICTYPWQVRDFLKTYQKSKHVIWKIFNHILNFLKQIRILFLLVLQGQARLSWQKK